MTTIIRPPAVAGMFYPAYGAHVRQMIAEYMDAAEPPALTDVRAVVAPHAGYTYSGPVAAYAYKLLAQQPEKPRRIYLLGPSHRVWFSGVAVADYDVFRTPLGDVPVDRAAGERLVRADTRFRLLRAPHELEHCLEVQLPFLQTIYDDFAIVPILFGDVSPLAVGETLQAYVEADDLIVVSSDLSHYHDQTTAQRLDHHFLDALLAGDKEGVAQGEACGQAPALALMVVAEARGWQPHLLDYRTSGDTSGDYRRVVGYASVAYTAM